jgi:hypothetical protein
MAERSKEARDESRLSRIRGGSGGKTTTLYPLGSDVLRGMIRWIERRSTIGAFLWPRFSPSSLEPEEAPRGIGREPSPTLRGEADP